jgi:hypothetical protein
MDISVFWTAVETEIEHGEVIHLGSALQIQIESHALVFSGKYLVYPHEKTQTPHSPDLLATCDGIIRPQ